MTLLLLYRPRDPGGPVVSEDFLDIWRKVGQKKATVEIEKAVEEIVEDVKELKVYKEFRQQDKEKFRQVQIELLGLDNRLSELQNRIKILEGEKKLELQKKQKELLEYRTFYIALEKLYIQRIRELEEDELLFLFMIS